MTQIEALLIEPVQVQDRRSKVGRPGAIALGGLLKGGQGLAAGNAVRGQAVIGLEQLDRRLRLAAKVAGTLGGVLAQLLEKFLHPEDGRAGIAQAEG